MFTSNFSTSYFVALGLPHALDSLVFSSIKRETKILCRIILRTGKLYAWRAAQCLVYRTLLFSPASRSLRQAHEGCFCHKFCRVYLSLDLSNRSDYSFTLALEPPNPLFLPGKGRAVLEAVASLDKGENIFKCAQGKLIHKTNIYGASARSQAAAVAQHQCLLCWFIRS